MKTTSKEYLHIELTGPDARELSVDAIQISIGRPAIFRPAELYDPTPNPADYPAAELSPGSAIASIMVGPGSTIGQLPVGTHPVQIQFTVGQEQPVIDCYHLRITP